MGGHFGGCAGRSAMVSDDDGEMAIKMWREIKGGEHMLLGIQDRIFFGKVLLCGSDSTKLAGALSPILGATGNVEQGKDGYDRMWDVAWCGTHITSGFVLFGSSWFPKGKVLVQIFDAFSDHGWILADSPNFGGPVGDKQEVNWPVLVFRRGPMVKHVVLGVKDCGVTGKVFAAGPEDTINYLKIGLTEKLQSITPSVTCEPDAEDGTWDAVWQNTQITTGHASLSLQNPYFPKGKTVLAALEVVYNDGWRLACCPNFETWPVFVFQKSEAPKPKLLLMAVKDQNAVGKVCLAGEAAGTVAAELREALAPHVGMGGSRNQEGRV